MVQITNNDDLLKVLRDREVTLASLTSVESWDDWQLNKINTFKVRFNALTQLEKDLYWVYLMVGFTKGAKMFNLNIETYKKRIKRIKAKML